jgi:hypothetical protein
MLQNKPLSLLGKIALISTLTLGSYELSYAAACDPANSTTVDKITACISQTHLTSILQNFQNISDSNPDYTFANFTKPGSLTPPGSRDAGTPGDIASVTYIANYMHGLGYAVTIQSYPVPYSADKSIPILAETSPTGTVTTTFAPGTDYSTAEYSASGNLPANINAPVYIQAISTTAPTAAPSGLGCSLRDFAGFKAGNIALLQRGKCANRIKVLNAIAKGAVGVITINYADINTGNTLISPAGMTVPVFAYIPLHVGLKLYNDTGGVNGTQAVHMFADTFVETRTTYNVIADSVHGNPASVVVLGGHYDSLFGAGILDNASGVASMMEIAAAIKDTPTTNKIRFGFWGGEELNLLGSSYYVNNLSSADLNKIVYNMDFDVTATPNFAYIISDPAYAIANPTGAVTDSKQWKQNAVNLSSTAVDLFKGYLNSIGKPYDSIYSDLDISGSDDDTFILLGIPIGSLVTGQGDGKTQAEASIFGGTAGNFDRCADAPYVFCDNIDNTDPVVHFTVTKAFAAVTVGLAFNPNLANNGNHYATGQSPSGGTKHFAP